MAIRTAVLALGAAMATVFCAQAQDRLVVVNKSDDTVSLVDAASYAEQTVIAVGENPHEVAISPDGSTAYVSDYGPEARGETISVIDLDAGAVSARWDLDGNLGPHGIWASADGANVWTTTETTGTVVEIDAATGDVTRVWETGQQLSHQLVPAPDGSKLFVANITSGSVSVIDRAYDSVTTVRTGPGAEGIDVSPDGAEVWVTNRDSGTISVIDAATDAILESFPSGGQVPIRLKFTPDGEEAWVSNAASGEVTVFDVETRELIAAVEVGAAPVGLLMSPDGSRVFVANTGADRVSVIDRETYAVVDSFEAGDEPDGLGWAPAE
ncbi:hypothetical protein DDZ18_12200 [Marinicauda salina]|uniref:YncE family protein n=1 Tax=Marinicauda salina TaxID=2135793 RepID=A0A2U2BR87_9PROT|nr:cytochrome D1 domain-containing protein [Marinicauda salina]PWE16524.1 hypothetical protein DDZ18_12200 [Marinicauda salina]